MKYYNIFDLKLQELYIFITAAEYESITRAAEYLYLTPSQVSKTIKKLEHQWGVQLFMRDKNTIRLTPAGKHAYQGLNHTMEDIGRVVEETMHIQEVKPFIRIGCPTLSEPNELLVPIVERFLGEYPNISVTIECKDTLSALRKMLIGGEVDLIYTTDTDFSEHMDLIEWEAVEEIPLYVIMNRKHTLAQKEDLQIEDLRYEEFVLTMPSSELYIDYAVQLCREHGFTPRIARYVPNIYSQLMELHINPKVLCIQTIKGSENDQSLCCRELPGICWKMGFAWRKDAPKVVTDFISCARLCREDAAKAGC